MHTRYLVQTNFRVRDTIFQTEGKRLRVYMMKIQVAQACGN
jgi:hypothetical protein